MIHVDTHMGAVAHFKFVFPCIELAMQHHLPLLMMRLDEAGWRAVGLDAETAGYAVQLVQQLEAQGVPLLDHLIGLPLEGDAGDRIESAKRELSALPPGLSHLIIHPAQDSPELRAITTAWRSRVADYQAFTSEELRTAVRKSGLQVIGYRALRDLMQQLG